MRMASDDSPDAAVAAGDAGADGPERRCILTGAHGRRDRLIRLVVGPDGVVWPDLAARLPGRGAWVVANRAVVAEAVARGRLRGAMARAMRATAPAVPDDLADRIASGLRLRALQRLGLEMRAGHLIWGSDRLAEHGRAGRLHLLLHAADAAPDGAGKLDQALRVGGGTMDRVWWLPCDRLALSSALGRDNMVHAGVADPGAAARIMADVARWSAFLRGTQADSSGSVAGPPITGPEARVGGQPDQEPQAAPAVDEHAGQFMAGRTNEGRE